MAEDDEDGRDEGEEDDEEEEGGGSGGGKKLLIIIGAAVLLVFGGVAAAYFTGSRADQRHTVQGASRTVIPVARGPWGDGWESKESSRIYASSLSS